MDRSHASKCLAKAIAYVACGKYEDAGEWLHELLDMFRDAGVDVARVGEDTH